jgi:DNA polymerase type B, organellar and viral
MPNSSDNLHVVNCVCAYLLCNRCIQKGTWQTEDSEDCPICGINIRRRHEWIGPGAVDKFVEWLLQLGPKEQTIAVAHYAGKYDMHFVLGVLYGQGGITPELIKKGEKLYQIRKKKKGQKQGKVVFRDSYNWIPLRLAKMPSALGLADVEDKGHFPHFYNREVNMDVELPNLPPLHYYSPDSMKEADRFAFLHWYYANAIVKKTPFHLRKDVVDYCRNDVDILTHALVRYQKLFTSIAGGRDVLRSSITIAGFCLNYFIFNYMKPGDIAIIPEHGYSRNDRQSAIALKYLKWIAHRYYKGLRHRDSPRGEKRLKVNGHTYKLDGYSRRRNLCIEFNGL